MESTNQLTHFPFRGKGVLFLLSFSLLSFSQNYPSGKTILDKVDNNMSAKTRVLTTSMEVGTE